MPTTRCADAAERITVTTRLSDLPAAALTLFDCAADRDLFCDLAWYRTVLACGMAADAVPRFVLCHAATPDDAVVLLPMQTRAHGRQLSGLSTLYTCRYQPLCDPAADSAALRAAFTAFARYCRGWATVRLDAIDAEAAWLAPFLDAAASAGLAARRFDHFGNWHEHVAGQGWAGYLGARPGPLRETIRRRLGRARRTGGRFELVQGGAALESGIAAYETVYARSWKPTEPFPQFNAALMRAAAAQGKLRLGLYWLEDRPVAAQLWMLDAGRAVVLKLAHDETAKADSPGTVLTALMLQYLLDQESATEIDFGRGDDAYKRLWARERRQRIGVVLANPRHPVGLAFLARHALGRARHAMTG